MSTWWCESFFEMKSFFPRLFHYCETLFDYNAIFLNNSWLLNERSSKQICIYDNPFYGL